MALDPILFTNVWGEDTSYPASRNPPGLVRSAQNIFLEKDSLGRRRPQWVAIDTTSGPSSAITYLFRHQPGVLETGSGGAELWAFANSVSLGNTIHRRVNGTWSSVSISDTSASFASSRPHAATLNGKMFIAYDSDVNRLHVWDGTVLRRVGIEASAAPTVADTGSGSYAATIRYYKVQFTIKSGSNTVATSELSASQSFTPSGSGTAARVTKPTTPDSATHWRVYGSADDITFYALGSADIAVGTTTYDDSAAPSSYSDGAVAPTVGLNVPPPAAKYLLSADNRLFMAGCWETTATSTQTATRNSRVWFTAVLGARDNTGEDEAITQTLTLRHWVDCGENDGDAIIGLGGPLDGTMVVFKRRSIWRLTPTGNPDVPYRADRLSDVVGARDQSSITMGEDGSGHAVLYFMSDTGMKRLTPGYGLEDLGTVARILDPVMCWDPIARMLLVSDREESTVRGFQPEFEQRVRGGVIGGWTTHSFTTGGVQGQRAICLYEVLSSGVLRVVFGGGTTGGPGGTCVLGSLASILPNQGTTPSASDAGGAFTPRVISDIYQPAGLLRRFRCDRVVLEWTAPGGAPVASVTAASVIDGPTAVTGTLTDTATATSYAQQTVVQEVLESLQLADVYGLQLTVTWDTTVNGSERPQMIAVTVDVTAQDPA